MEHLDVDRRPVVLRRLAVRARTVEKISFASVVWRQNVECSTQNVKSNLILFGPVASTVERAHCVSQRTSRRFVINTDRQVESCRRSASVWSCANGHHDSNRPIKHTLQRGIARKQNLR
jgi:hypothetical protein